MDFHFQVNNAGISGVYVADVLKGTDEWKKTMDVNLMGPLQLSRLASTHWLRNKRKGLIINTGSISEFLFHQDPQYRASKAALSAQVATIKGSGDLKGTPYGRSTCSFGGLGSGLI